jgi:sialate O-acetylesterase
MKPTREMRRLALAGIAVAVSWAATARNAQADVRLPALVSDGMVLQERTRVRVWGWADEGETVKVTFRGQSAEAHAQGGKWAVMLNPLEPGGPFTLTISGNRTIELKDVYVGEVWVCSGQSNMEFSLAGALDARKDIESPADPLLRMFTVARQVADTPQADVERGRWESATPQTRAAFSAVGYYFGRALRRARNVPIGVIHSSWGGTPAEAWTSRPALLQWGMPASSFQPIPVPSPSAREDYERRMAAWRAAGAPEGHFDDPGVADSAKSWALPRTDIRDWGAVSLPQPWERVGPEMEIDGGVWFRKEIDVPARWAGRDLDLSLGAIDDFDTTYFDGVKVGATGMDTPQYWETPRRYKIPGSLVKAGRSVLAVRVWDRGGAGGFMGRADAMWLAPAASQAAQRPDTLQLSGDWRFKVEARRPSRPEGPPGHDPHAPSVLYDAMIAPLLPYAIRGVAWYQGESNAGRAGQYRSLLSAMIRNWRDDWGVGAFPFLIVQLAPFMDIRAVPEESDWAELREAQLQVTQSVPNTGLVVITDAGDEKDIHPTKKMPVGERLALGARKLAYGEPITAFGPTFKSVAIAGGRAIVRFDHVGQGLEVRGDRLTGFALAGPDKKFVFADAVIRGNDVVVSSTQVPAPAYVRFGWANYPVVNLFNRDGLPASPFRSDAP